MRVFVYFHASFQDVHSLPVQNDYPFPSAKTEIQHVSIASAEVLTRHDSVKTTMKLTLDISVSTSVLEEILLHSVI